MKKYILLLLFISFIAQGNTLATFDKVSQSWIVKNNFYSCIFLEGQLFPSDFTFKDNKSSCGVIIFNDTATCSKNKKYLLLEERWAESKIVKNTQDTFIIQRKGSFFNNSNPLISKLDGVSVTCTFKFTKTNPAFEVTILYQKDPNVTCTINTSLNASWFYKNPFDKISNNNKTEDLALKDNSYRSFDKKNAITLIGKKSKLTIKSKRIITVLKGNNETYPLYINGGFWQKKWEKEDTLSVSATFIPEAL
jgi:hypothetical protein